MENLDTYYDEYQNGYVRIHDYNASIGGYTCLNCGDWVMAGTYHYCHPCTITYYSSSNNIEKAFKIMKLLVREKIIKEPDSFDKFCELIEKIAKEV